jgi:hypothetical protein
MNYNRPVDDTNTEEAEIMTTRNDDTSSRSDESNSKSYRNNLKTDSNNYDINENERRYKGISLYFLNRSSKHLVEHSTKTRQKKHARMLTLMVVRKYYIIL